MVPPHPVPAQCPPAGPPLWTTRIQNPRGLVSRDHLLYGQRCPRGNVGNMCRSAHVNRRASQTLETVSQSTNWYLVSTFYILLTYSSPLISFGYFKRQICTYLFIKSLYYVEKCKERTTTSLQESQKFKFACFSMSQKFFAHFQNHKVLNLHALNVSKFKFTHLSILKIQCSYVIKN